MQLRVGQEDDSRWLFRECWRPRCFGGVDRDSCWGEPGVFINSWILEESSVELLVTTHITGMGWWSQVSTFLHFGSDFLFFFFFHFGIGLLDL